MQQERRATFDHNQSRPGSRWNTFSTSGGRGGSRARPNFNLKPFGRDDHYAIEEFVSVMDDYVRGFDNAQPEDISAAVRSYLTGEAATIVFDSDAKTWEQIKATLIGHFRRTHMAKLMAMRRNKGETPASLAVIVTDKFM